MMESALMMLRMAFEPMDKPEAAKSRSRYSSPCASPSFARSAASNNETGHKTSSCCDTPSEAAPRPSIPTSPSPSSPSSSSPSHEVLNPFTVLPPEIIFHVISFVSFKDAVRLTETSRLCAQYGNDDMVWKGLIQSELGVTFLDGAEHIFDEHITRVQHPDQMELEKKPSCSWKERFQYLLSIKNDLLPVQYRSMRIIREATSDCCRHGQGGALSSLGCKHYKRDCKLFAACCARFFVCRHCHDEQVHDHRIDRYATQLVLCMACKSIQKVQQSCASAQCNNRPLGSYFCGVCKFYDNDPEKAIFHCEHCQVCKLGKKSESFHCHICGRCFSKAVMATHPCLTKRQQTSTDER